MPGTISVEMKMEKRMKCLIPKNVIVATGSRPNSLPGLEIDGEYVMSSDEALKMETFLAQSLLLVAG